MPRWDVAGELFAFVAFLVGLCLVFSQVFRTTPNIPVFCGGLLLVIVAMIGFSDSNARPGR